MHVTNNCGESVRVKVIYRDGNTEDIILDNNKTQSFQIRGTLFMEPDDCEVDVVVSKLNNILIQKKPIPIAKNEVSVFINKGNVSPEIVVILHTWNIDK